MVDAVGGATCVNSANPTEWIDPGGAQASVMASAHSPSFGRWDVPLIPANYFQPGPVDINWCESCHGTGAAKVQGTKAWQEYFERIRQMCETHAQQTNAQNLACTLLRFRLRWSRTRSLRCCQGRCRFLRCQHRRMRGMQHWWHLLPPTSGKEAILCRAWL